MVSKLVNKGIEYYNIKNYDKALKSYKKALEIANINQIPIIYYNIGLVHFSLYNYKAAKISFEKSFYDNYETAGYELSMTYLFLNEFEKGMSLYKYRYLNERKSFPDLPLPIIKNVEDVKGKKILVLNEQGFGDEILFSRSLIMLNELCESSKYQIYHEMFELFSDNFKFDNIEFFTDRSFDYDFIKEFDAWIPSGDLFRLFILENGCEKYLNIKTKERKKVGNLKVGLCFKTNGLSKNTKERSIDLDILEEILNYDDIDVISLQKDFSNDWVKETNINNFSDTSNIIDDLDVVVTVDTVVAHLSGIKGVKTLLIYDKYLDWRWNYNFYQNIELVNINDLEDVLFEIMS